MGSYCSGYPIDTSLADLIYTPSFIEAVQTGDWDAVDPFGCVALENTIRESEIPYESTAPVFMVIAEDDELTIAEPALDDVVALCDQGYIIEHIECEATGHTDAALYTVLDQLNWARARVAGEPLDPDLVCVVSPPVLCE